MKLTYLEYFFYIIYDGVKFSFLKYVCFNNYELTHDKNVLKSAFMPANKRTDFWFNKRTDF